MEEPINNKESGTEQEAFNPKHDTIMEDAHKLINFDHELFGMGQFMKENGTPEDVTLVVEIRHKIEALKNRLFAIDNIK